MNSFGSAITLPHFLHLVTSNDSSIGIKIPHPDTDYDFYPLTNPWTPSQPTSVGGIYIPVNKLELLAPYSGLTILLAVAVVTVAYAKKDTEINS